MASLNDLTPGTWNIDPAHSELSFTARHLMVTKVRGKFTDFTASVESAPRSRSPRSAPPSS